MLQQDEPKDYVIGTGETHSVREFLEKAFAVVGINEWEQYVQALHPDYVRPAEVDLLIADASKAKQELGWSPKTSFEQLVKLMVEADLDYESKR